MARPKDPAERRRIVEAMERKERTQRATRYTIVVVVAIIVIAAGAYGLSKLPKKPGKIHWHATFDVYVNDNLVGLNPQTARSLFFDYQTGGTLEAHVHVCKPDLLHNEGIEGKGSLQALFNEDWVLLGGKLTSNELSIPSGASFAGDYKTDATHNLTMYVSYDNSTWSQPVPVSTSLQDGMRYLLVYGNQSATDGNDPQILNFESVFPKFEQRLVC